MKPYLLERIYIEGRLAKQHPEQQSHMWGKLMLLLHAIKCNFMDLIPHGHKQLGKQTYHDFPIYCIIAINLWSLLFE